MSTPYEELLRRFHGLEADMVGLSHMLRTAREDLRTAAAREDMFIAELGYANDDLAKERAYAAELARELRELRAAVRKNAGLLMSL